MLRYRAVEHGPKGIRTPNLLIRSQMLYPVELWTQNFTRGEMRDARGESPPLHFSGAIRFLPALLASRLSLLLLVQHGRYKTRTCDLHDVNVAL